MAMILCIFLLTLILIGTEPDGYNINHECGSTHPERVQDEVIKQRADFGIALDGDGDRVVLIDRMGNVLDGDDIMYILAYANPNRHRARWIQY
jgi:phosphoglucosamine mutase